MGTPALFNFSFPAVTLRILDPPVKGQRLPANWEFGLSLQDMDLIPVHATSSVGVGCLIYVLGVILLFWSSRGHTGRQVQPLWLAALTSLALVSSPVAWSHYQLLQYPAAAYLLASFLRQGRASAAVFVAAVFLGLYKIPFLGLDMYLRRYSWTNSDPLSLWLFSTLAPICGLLLFSVCLWELKRGRHASASEY
jgi:hypothetical protein